MPTTEEETQAKEFLKRAEIKTMRKDLLALREVDALKERNKIATIKTLEEQMAEKVAAIPVPSKAVVEKEERAEVLQKNEGQERIAEKDLKNYATEEERQKIFLFESQRLGFEKQIDDIDKVKDPTLKLDKNKLLLQKRDWQAKLDSILGQESNFEGEQKVIIDKEQTTTVGAERKGLESARWDLDKKIQDVEKKRWEAEKQIQEIESKISEIDNSSDQLVIEKNHLRDKVLGVDKSLREIYTAVMAREEEKRRGQAAEQVAKRESLATIRAGQKEKVQREQRMGTGRKDSGYLVGAPAPVREKILRTAEAEEAQRKKFLEDVENLSERPEPKTNALSAPQISSVPPPPAAPTPPKRK